MRYLTAIVALLHFGVPIELLAQSANLPLGGQTLWELDDAFMTNPMHQLGEGMEGSELALHRKFMDHWAPRLYPEGDFGRLNNAIEDYKQYRIEHDRADQSFNSTWTLMGPNDTPFSTNNSKGTGTGQIHAITFHPEYDGTVNRTVYCGSSFGGLFITDDAGEHWQSLAIDSLPFDMISDIVVASDVNNTVFVSTGGADGWNYCSGIYRSGDGGQTFQHISADLDFTPTLFFNIYSLEGSVLDAGLLFAATTHGVYKCSNATADAQEVQWTLVLEPAEQEMWKGLVFKPGTTDTIYAGGDNIYMGTNGGTTWSSLSDAPFAGLDLDTLPWTVDSTKVTRVNLAVTPNDPNALYALVNSGRNYAHGKSYAYEFRAEPDSGHWSSGTIVQSLPHKTSPGWVPMAASPDPARVGTVYYGSLQVHRTSNGGGTMDQTVSALHDDTHVLTFSPDGSELWLGCDGGIYRSTDPYATNMNSLAKWQRRNNGLSVGTIFRLSNDPSDAREVMIAEQDEGITRLDPADVSANPWKFLYYGDGSQVLYSPTGREAWGFDLQYHWWYRKWRNNIFNPYSSTNYGSYNPSAPDSLGGNGGWIATWHPPMKIHEETNRMYYGWSDIWEERDITAMPNNGADSERRSQIQLDFGDPDFPCNSQALLDAEIEATDKNNIFILLAATPVSTGCPNGTDGRLIRSVLPAQFHSPGLPMYEEVALPTDAVAPKCVRTTPWDPEEIWVIFSGFEGSEKVFRSEDRGDSWTNMDPSASLPNLPCTDLVFHKGTQGGTYLAMDGGVFYTNDALEGAWEPFHEDLPNVVVSDIEINYCASKIRAGTYGRALWESDLAEKASAERVVDIDSTWSHHRNLAQDVRVTSNSTLTISNTVNFAPGTRLIIEPGSKVIVEDGGILTNLCGERWDGIEVLGNPTVSQSPLTNQGYLELRAGANIEHADIAVRLFGSDEENVPDPTTTGGVVRSLGYGTNTVKIRYCGAGISAEPYGFYNRSRVYRTEFLCDEPNSKPFIRLNGVSTVRVENCTFGYTGDYTPGLTPVPTGIHGFNSRFVALHNTFQHLGMAVRASSTDVLTPCFILGNSFLHNERGVFLSNVAFAEITSNDFLVPETVNGFAHPYGAYLSGCSGYEVEENAFSAPREGDNVGLLIRDSDDGPTEFYRNTFNGLAVGSLLQGDNRLEQSLDGGLQSQCNTYGETDACLFDLAVTEEGEVAEHQGTEADPAGNRFFPECSGWDETDIYVDTDPAPPTGFYYHHHADDFTTPACTTAVYVLGAPAGDTYDEETSCPENLSANETRPERKTAFFLHSGQHAELKAVYDGEVNGGDTEYLISLIADPSVTSFSLRNALLASSPELSDQVLVESIKREPAMDQGHLVQVLLANSPMSPDVRIALSEITLAPVYYDLLYQQQNGGMTWRTLVEMELNRYASDAELARGDYIRLILQEDSLGIPMDSIALVLEHDSLTASGAIRLSILIAQGEWTDVQDRLDNYADHSLTVEEVVVFTALRDLALDPTHGVGIVTDVEADLLLIAADHSMPGHEAAKCLLAQYLGTTFDEPVILPAPLRRFIPIRPHGVATNNLLQITPNPVDAQANIIARVPSDEAGAFLALSDMHGQEIRNIPVQPGTQLLVLDTRNITPGIYRFTLFGRSGALDGRSVTIIH